MKRYCMIVVAALLGPLAVQGAERYWTGASNSTFALDANWSVAFPNDGDKAMFLTADDDKDVAGADLNTVGLAEFNIGQLFDEDSDIGTWTGSTLTTPLKIGATEVIIRGGGNIGLHPGSASNEYSKIILDSGSTGKNILFQNDDDVSTVGVTVVIIDGDVTLESGYYREVFLDPLSSDDPTLTIGSAHIKDLWVYGGAVTMTGNGDIDTVHQQAGTVTTSDGQVLALYLNSGTFYWHTNQTMSLAHIAGGTLTSAADPRGKTLTTLRLLAGAVVNFNTGTPDSVTVTNNIEQLGPATVQLAPGQILQLQ